MNVYPKPVSTLLLQTMDALVIEGDTSVLFVPPPTFVNVNVGVPGAVGVYRNVILVVPAPVILFPAIVTESVHVKDEFVKEYPVT